MHGKALGALHRLYRVLDGRRRQGRDAPLHASSRLPRRGKKTTDASDAPARSGAARRSDRRGGSGALEKKRYKKASAGPSCGAQRDRQQGGNGHGPGAGPRAPGDELGGRGRGVGPARGRGPDHGGGVGGVLGEVLVAAGDPAGGAESGGRPRHRETEICGLGQHAAALRHVLRGRQAGEHLDVPADHALEEVLSAAGGEDVDGLGERAAHLRLARADAVRRHARDDCEQACGVAADGVRRRREQGGESESHHACHGLEGWERRRKPGQGFCRA